MPTLFGAAGEDLCGSMEARMRLHAALPAKEMAEAGTPSAPALYAPAQGAPVVSPAFDFVRSFKHAA